MSLTVYFGIIQQGKLAKELDFVSHHVRTKLDELKRQEVNRLRTLIKAKQDLEGGNGTTPPTKLKFTLSSWLFFRKTFQLKYDVEIYWFSNVTLPIDIAVDHQALLKQFEYLNHMNPHTFEVDDLDLLIKSVNKFWVSTTHWLEHMSSVQYSTVQYKCSEFKSQKDDC